MRLLNGTNMSITSRSDALSLEIIQSNLTETRDWQIQLHGLTGNHMIAILVTPVFRHVDDIEHDTGRKCRRLMAYVPDVSAHVMAEVY